MTDLTTCFEQAERRGAASEERVWEVLRALAAQIGGTVDWEPPDEEWGRALAQDEACVALVCRRLPVVLVRRSFEPSRQFHDFEWLAFDDEVTPDFAVSKELFERVWGRPMSLNVNWNRLSIQELWWATVT